MLIADDALIFRFAINANNVFKTKLNVFKSNKNKQ